MEVYDDETINLQRFEELLGEDKTDFKSVFAVVSKYWSLYKITGNKMFLHKANHRAVTSFAENSGSIMHCMLLIFINIELGHIDKAEETLENLSYFKNYYKNNNVEVLNLIYYFKCDLELRKDKKNKALKSLKNLEDMISYSESKVFHIGFYFLLLGDLYFKLEEHESAFSSYESAFLNGYRGCYLYLSIYNFVKGKFPVNKESSLFLYFFNWAISHNLEIEGVLQTYGKNIFLTEDFNAYERIYEKYPKEWLLEAVCNYFIKSSNYSKKAYEYYRLAEVKQLQTEKLSVHLIKAAYQNDMEDVSRYSLKEFLNNFETEIDMKAYIYHLIFTNDKFEGIYEIEPAKLLEFAFYCLENKISNRYVNSIFKHILDNEEKYEIPENYAEIIQKSLFEDMFVYEITAENSAVKFIWINEKEKRESVCYTVKSGVAKIIAVSSDFTYICFSEAMKSVLDSKIKISKLVEKIDYNLYFNYYKDNSENVELILALARYFTLIEKPKEEFKKHQAEILKKAVTVEKISSSFKVQITAVLANLLFVQGSKEKALEYYKNIDETYLNDKYVSLMLRAFVETKDYKKALKLVNRRKDALSDKILFEAVRAISSNKDFRPFTANFAYELILKSWYDKNLLDTVLKYFKGSQEEWQNLSKALTIMSVPDKNINEIILKNSIIIRKFDVNSQKIFAKMFDENSENETVGFFAYYCIYEITVNNVKPEYETIAILEKIYQNYGDNLLAYALSFVYLNHNINTDISDEILSKIDIIMERDEILPNIFKNTKDKRFNIPYIIKNTPFIYRTLPNKNVYLCYTSDGSSKERKVKMKYFRFGFYMCTATHFYGENISYYFTEELPTGSISTQEFEKQNTVMILHEEYETDTYFSLNNALIYEQMFKYEEVEKIITETLAEPLIVNGKLL